MEITYRLRPEDLVAFADHLGSGSSSVRKAERSTLISLCILWIFAGWTVWLATRAVALLVAWLFLGLIGSLFAPAALKGTRRKRIADFYGVENKQWVFEPETLRIEQDGLFAEGVRGTRLTKWEYIERIIRTDGYLFIYPNETEAWIVSDHGVVRGDYDSFAKAIDQRWRAATAAATPNRSGAALRCGSSRQRE
jgi:hypothetical protein